MQQPEFNKYNCYIVQATVMSPHDEAIYQLHKHILHVIVRNQYLHH